MLDIDAPTPSEALIWESGSCGRYTRIYGDSGSCRWIEAEGGSWVDIFASSEDTSLGVIGELESMSCLVFLRSILYSISLRIERNTSQSVWYHLSA